MTGWLLVAQAATPGATTHAADMSMARPPERPTFADEFVGRAVDRAIWRFDPAR